MRTKEKESYLLWLITGEVADNTRHLALLERLLPNLDANSQYEVRSCLHTKKLHVTPTNGLNIRDCSCRFRGRMIGVIRCRE